MGVMRRKPDPVKGILLCDRLPSFDLGLMLLVETSQDELNTRVAGGPVAINCKLRLLRYQIAIEVRL